MPLARIVLVLGLLPVWAAAQNVSIKIENGKFQVSGWSPGATAPSGGWESLFSVYAGEGDLPPMLGTYTVENGSLVFRPRFPLSPGVRTRAVFRTPGALPVVAIFEASSAAPTAAARVDHVYPSTSVLPDNQLKFYLQFSAPMSRGEVWQRIHLLDQNGKAVDLPFLEIAQELWDRDYRRLTVLFDPGRIKRGLLPLEEVGPAIEEGKSYTLVIDREWLDARGVPMTEGFRKAFRVGPSDRTPPDPATWGVSAPKAGTADPLVVKFPESMDWALSLRLIDVPGVPGTASVESNETEWRFKPNAPWKTGEYKIAIDTALEDLAGNRIGRAFDVDTFERVSEKISGKTVSLPFRIGQN